MFSFNYEKYDFWPIYDSIIKHYPIGIPKDESGMYAQYPGIKQLESIIVEKIHDENSDFSRCWVKVEEALAKPAHHEVIGSTYAQGPSFSSRIIIEKIPSGNWTRCKELFMTVSLLGPYYTVLGRDVTEIILENKDPYFPMAGKRYYSSTTILTVSPEQEYADVFNLACQTIEDRFPGYRFVPYAIYNQTLSGLEVKYSDERRDTVFQALFNDQVDLNAQIVGHAYFKSNDWIKEDYQDDGGQWTIYPPIGL